MRAPLTGTKRKDGRWQITVQLTTIKGQKVRKTLYAPTQSEVQAKARQLIYTTGREAPNDSTLQELIDLYRTFILSKMSDGAKRQYEWAFTKMEFGRVVDIDMPHVVRWLRSLDGLSGRSIQVCRNVLKVLLEYARELGWIKDNPARGAKLPRPAISAPRRRMSESEWLKIVAAEPNERHRAYWRILGETGMRPSEALGLVEPIIEDGFLRLGKSKTIAGENRIVPVSKQTAEYLRENPRPFPMDLHNVQRAWRNALKRAEIPHTNLYQLRKMRLTLWIAQGLPDEVVKELAGHSSIELTMNVYTRIPMERVKAALDEAQSVKGLSAKSMK
ncbi:MAG TPA: site-specific integrase [Fimbriimonadaceae bacterium]|nr:site-specific integrase [Fimbriimonadaceae bacterium]